MHAPVELRALSKDEATCNNRMFHGGATKSLGEQCWHTSAWALPTSLHLLLSSLSAHVFLLYEAMTCLSHNHKHNCAHLYR